MTTSTTIDKTKRDMHLNSASLPRDLCHAAYQSGHKSLKSLYPLKGPFKLTTALVEFGRLLKDSGRNPTLKDPVECLAMGIVLPLPGASDFVLLAGRPCEPENLDDLTPGSLVDPFGVGAHKAFGQNDEQFKVHTWLVPVEVIKNAELEKSILMYKGDSGEVRIYQALLDEQENFGRKELSACELINSTFSELLQYKSWSSLYRPELLYAPDYQNSRKPIKEEDGPEFVQAYQLPSFMDLLGACFQLCRSEKSFACPIEKPFEILGNLNTCFNDLLEFYDPAAKSTIEVGSTGFRASALELNLFKNKTLASFDIIFQLGRSLKDQDDSQFPFERLVPLSVLYQKLSADESETAPARNRFRKPVTAIHVAPSLQVYLLLSAKGAYARLKPPHEKANSLYTQKRYTWAKPEDGHFGQEKNVLTENNVYPLALFYTHEDALCTLKDMQEVQGGPDELEVARMACIEPAKLAELLLPKAKDIEALMTQYGNELSPYCKATDD